MSAQPGSAAAAKNFTQRAAAEYKVMNWSPAGKLNISHIYFNFRSKF
jgi:hypothetical protein